MDTFLQHSFLCHHGIKGMKWGVRRYQNPDGSLTSAGKVRYGKHISLKKGQTVYRSISSKKSQFFHRKYTYVSVTNDEYEHRINTDEGFEGAHTAMVAMKTTKPLKIASVDDYIKTLNKLGFIKENKDSTIDDKIQTIRNLPIELKDGTYGVFEKFNKIVDQMIADGYDGCLDMVDGIHQYRDSGERKLTAMVIFEPSKNLKIEKIYDI